jgi:aminomethyltransferase
MLKTTPLHSAHHKLGARLIEFGGWEMPVCYTSIIDEHQTVRSAAGLFDISHMGEIFLRGPRAGEFVNSILTNDLSRLQPGQGQYSLLCNEHAGVIDDLYVYRIDTEEYLLIVNAARIAEDFHWIKGQLAALGRGAAVDLKDRSAEFGALAVQGPKVSRFIDSVFAPSAARPSALVKNEIGHFTFEGPSLLVSRTGYTGEDGFEIVAPAENIEAVWNRLLEAGAPFGIKPAGLGARDTLRLEACYPLYGHELDEKTTPLEAGLGFFVALGKGAFVGRSALAEQKAKGTARKLTPFKMTGRSAPPRPGYSIWSASAATAPIGQVTSGTQSPSLGVGIGLGFVATEFSPANTSIAVEIRGRHLPALTAQRPLYRKS